MDKYETVKEAKKLSEKADRYSRICLNCLDAAIAAHYHIEGMTGEWPITTTVDRAFELYNRYEGKARICWKYYLNCNKELRNSLEY